LRDGQLRFGQQVPPKGACNRAGIAQRYGASKPAGRPTSLIVLVVVLVLVSTRLAVFAQTPPAGTPQPKLTLAQIISLAEKNYPRIRASLEQRAAAQGGVSVARTAYLPRTDILWQTNRATANNVYGLLLPQGIVPSISGPVLTADNGRSAWSSAGGVLLSWQPFDFGLRRAQVNSAQQGAAAATAGLNLTRLDVELATTSAYLDLVTAEQLSGIARANLERLQVFANSVHVLVDNQLRPGADASQADADLAVGKTQLIQANTNVAVRRAALADLVGIPTANLEAEDEHLLAAEPGEQPAPAPLATHPLAEQEAALVNQRQAQLSVITHSYVPQFSTLASLSGRGTGTALNGPFPGGTNGLAPNTLNWAAGVQVTFPAFDFFSLRAQKKVQEANVRAEQARYQQTLDDLSAQVQQAQAQLEGARQIALNTPMELAAARASEQQQRARFQAGLATVVEVAVSDSLLTQAEADDAVARLNIWRALAGVAAARGDLSPFLAQLTQP
jgi:outer membrane protein